MLNNNICCIMTVFGSIHASVNEARVFSHIVASENLYFCMSTFRMFVHHIYKMTIINRNIG